MRKTLNLGERVMLERRHSGLSQQELADAAGVSRSYIKDIEVGRVTNVGVDFIAAIAAALQVSPAYLLGYTETPLNEPDDLVLKELSGAYIVREVGDPHIRRLSGEVLDSFAALDPEGKQIIVDLLRKMRGGKESNAATSSSSP